MSDKEGISKPEQPKDTPQIAKDNDNALGDAGIAAVQGQETQETAPEFSDDQSDTGQDGDWISIHPHNNPETLPSTETESISIPNPEGGKPESEEGGHQNPEGGQASPPEGWHPGGPEGR